MSKWLSIMLAATAVACSSTQPFPGEDGKTLQGSIASMEKIEIGGVEQALLIRGKDVNNPVLLFVHGGPGTPYDGLAYRFQAPLEEKFVVVQWDQRGSGKSYKGTPKEAITVEQILKDAHQVMQYLTKRFDKQKLYLVGHSWGSYLGMYLVQRHPELIHAYIGASQGVDMIEQERFSHNLALEEAQKRGDKKVQKRLKKIGEVPYENPRDAFAVKYPILTRYGLFFYEEKRQGPYFKSVLKSKEYGFGAWVRYGLGLFYHYNNLLKNEGDNMWKVSPMNDVKEVKVPVYFIQGKHDGTSPGYLIDQYYRDLKAPYKKIVVLQNSGHFMFVKEPNAFCREIIKVLDREKN